MRIIEPSDNNISDPETGIVLFNQFGSTAAQDTGRDAQVLADGFGLPVLVVDRPGTAGIVPSRQLSRALATPDGYLAEMSLLGKKIDKQTEGLGLTRLLTSGRSAGGLGALALTRSETVSNIDAVYVAEPVGCENLNLKQGKKRYADYLKQQKKTLADQRRGNLINRIVRKRSRPTNGGSGKQCSK